jgi:intracellular multiplication protein IcmK
LRKLFVALSLLLMYQVVCADESSADLLGLGAARSFVAEAQQQTQSSTSQAKLSPGQSPIASANAPTNTAASNTTANDNDENLAQFMNQSSQNGSTATNGTSTTATPATMPPTNPWVPADDNEALSNAGAFRSVSQDAFPLSPDQINALRNMLDQTQRAQAAAPYKTPPAPTSTSLNIDLAPGAVPPVIRLSKGFVSSLVFIDSTGAPWPIEAFDLGDPTAFNISWDKKGNTLMIQARQDYSYGNLAVNLKNLNTPVMLTLVPGQRVVDYRVDMRVPGQGPQAAASIGDDLPAAADNQLLNVLNGIAPMNGRRLKTENDFAEVWMVGDVLYLRSAYAMLSPAWVAKMSSADGMNAYKLSPSPLVLLMRHGQIVSVKIEGLS